MLRKPLAHSVSSKWLAFFFPTSERQGSGGWPERRHECAGDSLTIGPAQSCRHHGPPDSASTGSGLARSFHLRWKQVPDPTHHSRKWAFSLLDTGFRHGPRGPTHESNHKADRFANVRVF